MDIEDKEWTEIKKTLTEEYDEVFNQLKNTMDELVEGVFDGDGEKEYLYLVHNLMKKSHKKIDDYVENALIDMEKKLKEAR